MTVIKVADASALIALLFDEPEAEAIALRLSDARLVAPPLLTYELANIYALKMRRHPDQKAALLEASRLRKRLAADELAVDPNETVQLAMARGLTAYDASYLWLSRHLGAELVTLDRRLAQAAATLA